MKSIIYFIAIMCVSLVVRAQSEGPAFDEVRSAYRAGNLDDARFALEQSLHEIDQALGREILSLLPKNMSGLNYEEAKDNVVGTNMGFAGLFVERNYAGSDAAQSANVEIIGDSPLLAALNTLMAMPTFMTGNQDQKRIKVNGYKSLVKKESSDDGGTYYSVQIPVNSTLITLECYGFDENQTISMANQIQVAQIAKLAQ